MNIKEKLDALLNSVLVTQTLNKLENGKNVFSGLSLSQILYIQRESFNQEELKDVLDWFIDGGIFYSEAIIKIPYGERKNSKKRQKTTYFFLKKGCFKMQIGHITQNTNFQSNGMQYLCEIFVNGCFQEKEPLGYYNGGMVNYVKGKTTLEDRGVVEKLT